VVVGCGGYVLLVVEAMWFWLRRLCVGELKNKTNLSPARATLLGLSLATSFVVYHNVQSIRKYNISFYGL
jgi:hypothetical protein